MKKFRIIILSALTFGVTSVFAQQEFQFGNYTHNPYLFNPAAGGLTDFTQIDLGYRNQHISSDGNPVTMYLSGHTQLYLKKNKGAAKVFNPDGVSMYTPPLNSVGKFKQIVGGRVINDGIGPFQKTGIMATYAVHLPLTKKLNFGAGLGLGWNNIGINPSKVVVQSEADDILQGFGARWNQNNLDLQAGLVVYTDRFTFSFSGTQLLGSKFNFSDAYFISKLNSHWLIYSSYKIKAGENFTVEPFMMARAVKNSPFSADLGAKVHYNYLWLGAQYRTSQSFVISLGLNFLKNLYLSYAFEYSAKATRVSTAGTHEIQLGIYLGKSRKAAAKTIPPVENTEEPETSGE